MQDQWKRELTEQVKKELDQYTPIRIPLDSARDQELVLAVGKTIYVQDSSGATAQATVKLNRDRAGDLALAKGVLIETVYQKMYLTNTALADQWLDVIFGRDFRMSAEGQGDGLTEPIEIEEPVTVTGTVSIQEPLTIDGTVAVSAVGGTVTVDGSVTTDDKDGNAEPCIIITNASIDTSTPGANNACKKGLVRSHTTNTGLIWVNTGGAAAVEGSCYPLAKGDAVSFRTTNTNQIACLFKVANEKVTVLYQN